MTFNRADSTGPTHQSDLTNHNQQLRWWRRCSSDYKPSNNDILSPMLVSPAQGSLTSILWCVTVYFAINSSGDNSGGGGIFSGDWNEMANA